ncbi:MAG: hypothetical protein ACOVQA_03625, partial [Thermoflexibacteraceae bacterium]|jgi:hypothetical protein
MKNYHQFMTTPTPATYNKNNRTVNFMVQGNTHSTLNKKQAADKLKAKAQTTLVDAIGIGLLILLTAILMAL